jgi:polyhydroxyalkanoate synthesis regulator phasin
VAAKTINTDVDTLYNAWDEGESLADVAQAHNVDLQQVTDAIVTAEKAWVDQMVGSGEFTQAEADEWLQDLNQNAVFFVIMGDEVDWEEVTAKAIGMDVDALFTAMMDGDASIAEVAQANGIDPQQVIDAIVTAEKAWLQELVTNGVIPQQESDTWLVDLEMAARSFIEEADDNFAIMPYDGE